jgi:hypothetical protein
VVDFFSKLDKVYLKYRSLIYPFERFIILFSLVGRRQEGAIGLKTLQINKEGLLCPYWKKKGLKAGNVALIIK